MPGPVHVWLLNMGGPDRPEGVRPFLRRLLGDPLVVPMPWGWLQRLFAWAVSGLRARRLIGVYERLGGASPQLAAVEEQARRLGYLLGPSHRVRPVFRYASPGAAEAAEELAPGDRVVLLSLYPQACRATTRTSIEDARRAIAARGVRVEVAEVPSYPEHPGYVEAVAETLRAALAELPRNTAYHVVFSAHGVPLRWVERLGDPYRDEVEATVRAVVAAAGLARPHHLSFQSRFGPTRWLRPSTVEVVRRLGREGAEAVVVVPVAFTSDHVETLVELDEALRAEAARAGIRHFVRADVVGTRPTFIRALADLVRRAERRAGWAED